MMEKDPTNWSSATWFLALSMAFGGGIVNWYLKVKQGHTKVFNLVELVGEIFISGFVGIGTFMALAAIDSPMGLCAAAAGVGGHMGTRLLFMLEKFAEKRAKRLLEIDDATE